MPSICSNNKDISYTLYQFWIIERALRIKPLFFYEIEGSIEYDPIQDHFLENHFNDEIFTCKISRLPYREQINDKVPGMENVKSYFQFVWCRVSHTKRVIGNLIKHKVKLTKPEHNTWLLWLLFSCAHGN